MSWKDNVRPGSWRGAPFLIRTADREGGRRGELHEFPGRDLPWFEDLGRSGRRFTFEAIVIGPDYMEARDKLIEACEAPGPGTLVHPFQGTQEAVCEHYGCSETTAEGGMAIFSFDFAEAGAILPPAARADTATAAAAKADEVQAEAKQKLKEKFSIEDLPAFVEKEAARLTEDLTGAVAEAQKFIGGAASSLYPLRSAIAQMSGGISDLLRLPGDLAGAVTGLVRSFTGLAVEPRLLLRGLRGLLNDAVTTRPVNGVTPSRLRQRANQSAFNQMVREVVAAEAVRVVASIDFASYDEAAAIRDGLAEELDMLAIAAADSGDDDGAEALDSLRLAMIRDVTARGGSLDRLYAFTPPATVPALVLAHRLYGDEEGLIEDAVEIVARNRIRHPGFVPGGVALEVRTDG